MRKEIGKGRRFQYILCYGSTVCALRGSFGYSHFNTSYVTVQLLYPESIPEDWENFNTSYVTVQPIVFKLNGRPPEDFNTSYVTVQRIFLWKIWKKF